jgi:hypothetical protein
MVVEAMISIVAVWWAGTAALTYVEEDHDSQAEAHRGKKQ